MTASIKVETVLTFTDGDVSWSRVVPSGSHVRLIGAESTKPCVQILGPTHDPYWLDGVGAMTKKHPK